MKRRQRWAGARSIILACTAAAAGIGVSIASAADSVSVVAGSANLDLSLAGSYSSGGLPGSASDVEFAASPTPGPYSGTYTVTSAALNIGTLDDLWTAGTVSIGGGTQSITLNGGSNSLSGTAADLLYVAAGATLNLSTNTLNPASSGNFDIVGTATIGSAISATNANLTLTGGGTLTLTGTVSDANTAINGGTMRISGGSLATQNVGFYSGGALFLNSGGRLTAGLVDVGGTAGPSIVTVAGSGSTLSAGLLFINDADPGPGTLSVTSGGAAAGSEVAIGRGGGTGSATITGIGSTLSATSGGITIGSQGGTGTLTLGTAGQTDGGASVVSAESIYVGDASPGSNGTITVYAGTTLTTQLTLQIQNSTGSSGTSVNLAGGTINAGTLDTTGVPVNFNWTAGTLNLTNSSLTIGSGGPLGSSLTLNSGQTLQVSGSNQTLAVSGTLTLGGGNVAAQSMIVPANGSTGTGTVTHTAGANTLSSVYTVGSTGYASLVLGFTAGSTGNYNLSGTGSLTTGGSYGEYIGVSGNGNLTQTGGTNSTGTIIMGGAAGGIGSYNLSAGSLVVSQFAANPLVNVGSNGTGAFTQSGGTVIIGNSTGTEPPGKLEISSAANSYSLSGTGSLTVYGTEFIYGSFSQVGGSNAATYLSIYVPSGYSLGGGTLTLGAGMDAPYGSGSLAMGGGTLAATAAWSSSIPITLSTGTTSTIDTTGGNISLSGQISGSGSLIVNGTSSSNLTLSNNNNTYAGSTTVNSGVLTLNSGQTGDGNGTSSIGSGPITVNSGAILNLTGNELGYNNAANSSLTINGTGVVNALGTTSDNRLTSLALNNGGTLALAANGLNLHGEYTQIFNLTSITSTGSGATTNFITGSTGGISPGGPGWAITASVARGTAASDLTISAPIQDYDGYTNSLSKTGAGILTLAGASTYSGGTTINAGTLIASTSASALGAGQVMLGNTTGTNSATLLVGTTGLTYSNPIVLAANPSIGTLTIGNTGTAVNATFSGGVTGTNNLTINENATTGRITFTSGAINNAGTITNIGTGSGQTSIVANISSNVTGVYQNSTTSSLLLQGNNTFTYNGTTNMGLNIQAGSVLADTTTLGSGQITLGNTTGSNSASLLDYIGTTISNPIYLATNPSAGTLTLGNGGPGAGTTNFTGGVTGTNNFTISENVTNWAINFSAGTINNTGTITNIGTGSATTTISANIGPNVTGLIENSASSALTISGSATYSGPTTISTGTLTVSGTGSIAGTSQLIVNGLLVINSTAAVPLNVATPGGDIYLGYQGASGTIYVGPSVSGIVEESNGSNFTIGNGGSAGTQGGTGAFFQEGGTVQNAGPAGLYVGVNGATGIYNISAGTLTLISGRTFFLADSNVGTRAVGTLNVNGGQVIIPTTFSVAASGATGSTQTATVNLNSGGILQTPGWTVASGAGVSSTLNFNGGTLQANAPSGNFLPSPTVVNLYAGGATVDTQANNVTISNGIASQSGSGVISVRITSADSTTVFASPPAVTFTGGAATVAASAYATLDANGHINGIAVTNAGIYTTAPTGISIASSTEAGSPMASANGGGTFTKLGAGILTLTGTNSYTAATAVYAGTLSLISPGVLGNTGVTVSGTGFLGGTGQIGNTGANVVAINSGGTIAPGTAGGNGTLTTGAEAWAGGSYLWKVTPTSATTASGEDDLIINGALNVKTTSGTFVIDVSRLGASATESFTAGTTFTVADATGGVEINGGSPVPAGYPIQPYFAITDLNGANGWAVQLVNDGNGGMDVNLSVTPTPEPGMLGLLTPLSLGLLRRRR